MVAIHLQRNVKMHHFGAVTPQHGPGMHPKTELEDSNPDLLAVLFKGWPLACVDFARLKQTLPRKRFIPVSYSLLPKEKHKTSAKSLVLSGRNMMLVRAEVGGAGATASSCFMSIP